MNNQLLYFLTVVLMAVLSSCTIGRKTIKSTLTEDRPPVYQISQSDTLASSHLVTISGMVREEGNDEPLLFGAVAVFRKGEVIAGTETDFDGRYSFQMELEYSTEISMEFSYLGFQTQRIEGIQVEAGKKIDIDVELSLADGLILEPIWGCCICIPLIRADDFGSGQTFTSEQIRRSGVRGN